MAALLSGNRVKETTTTTGTGDLTLAGAVAGYHTFAAAVGGYERTVSYLIEWGSSFELGLGTLNLDGTLSRTRVIQTDAGYALSGAGANRVSLPTGTKTVSMVNLSYNAVQVFPDIAQFDPGYGPMTPPMADASRATAVGLSAFAGGVSSTAIGFGAEAPWDNSVMIGPGSAPQSSCMSRLSTVNTIESFSIDHLFNVWVPASSTTYLYSVLVGTTEMFTGTIDLAVKATTGATRAGYKLNVAATGTAIIGSSVTTVGSTLANPPTFTFEMATGEGERSGAYPLLVLVDNTSGSVGLRMAARTQGVLYYS